MRKPFALRLGASALTLAALATLTACGGGGDNAPAVTSNEPPATASATEAGLVAYTASVANTPEATAPAEPVDLSNFTPPPTSEDGEPAATSADEGA